MNTITASREEAIVNQYRQERRNFGVKETDAKWAKQIIGEWDRMLESNEPTINRPEEIKATMRENLAIRDAIIIASMCDKYSVGQLTALAADAHGAKTKRIMNAMLAEAFTDGKFNKTRSEQAASLLEQLTDGDDEWTVQPHAIIAWLEWINGNENNAAYHAAKANELDDKCGLAALILTATFHGLKPDYLD